MKNDLNKTCPHCGGKAKWNGNPYRPFCSARCRLIDLGNWASGKYRIPGEKLSAKMQDEEESSAEEKDEKVYRLPRKDNKS